MQAKLVVGASGDCYEREADRIAEAVARADTQHPDGLEDRGHVPAISSLRRTCSSCADDEDATLQRLSIGAPAPGSSEEELEDEERRVQRLSIAGAGSTVEKEENTGLQRKESGPDAIRSAPPVVDETLQRPGRALDANTRRFMESRFGFDFSDVRIHTGDRASDSARAVRARAYTVGRDVVFGGSEYAPDTPSGRRLLAHELTHVVQQGSARRLGSAAIGTLAVGERSATRVSRQNQAQTNPVLNASAVASVQLFPSTLAGTRVGPSAGPGGIVRDSRPRVSAIIGGLTTIRSLAQHLLPLWNTATPFTPAGSNTPLQIPPLTVSELEQGLLVYNRYYLPVPAMTRWQLGLRFPLPILIDSASNEGILHPLHIRALAATFDPAWAPLLTQLPGALEAIDPAALQTEVAAFLAANPTTTSRGIALGARAITNATESSEFVLEALRQDPNPFELALEFMNFLVNHQIGVLATQTGGAAVLAQLRTVLAAPPASLSAQQQTDMVRANNMLGRVAAVQAGPRACIPERKLTWPDFAGTPGGGTFSARTVSPIGIANAGAATPFFQAVFSTAQSWVRPQFAQPGNLAVNGGGPFVQNCQNFFSTNTGTFNLTPVATTCAASIQVTPKVATSAADCQSVCGTEIIRAARLESERLLRHEQLHFDISCAVAQKASAVAAGGRAVTLAQARNRANVVNNQYDTQSNHGCISAQQASWETAVRNGLPAVNVP